MSKLELTPRCHDVLNFSKEKAKEFKHSYVITHHIFLSLLEMSETSLRVFEQSGVDIELLRKSIVKHLAKIEQKPHPENGNDIGFSPKISRLIALAGVEAKRLDSPAVGVHHLLLGILESDIGTIIDAISDHGIEVAVVRSYIIADLDPDIQEDESSIGEGEDLPEYIGGVAYPGENRYESRLKESNKNVSTIKKYCVNLTQLAHENKIDPVIGREDEIDQALQILLRRQKNNPIIIGEPGVGKTAIVEALACMITGGVVPDKLLNKKIYSLDLASVIAGTKYRGQFEERIKGIIDELKKDKNSILFIDEFHTVVGSGNTEGTLDACNLIKPAMARGEVTIIGATTTEEYRKYVEPDGALCRRLQSIHVLEPELKEVENILNNIKSIYERFHNVRYTKSIVKSIISLADRYINDKQFPDKAIDILDQVGASIRSQTSLNDAFDIDLENEIMDCEENKNKCIIDKDFEAAAKWKERQSAVERRYETKFKQFEKKAKKTRTITLKDIEGVVSLQTGIPCTQLDNNSLGRLKNIHKTISNNVIGQESAVRVISNAVRRTRAGLHDDASPLGTYLFLGPTGVGKTHLAKSLSKFLFGSSDKIIRMDMSEYREAHSISKLIGSPPGYVGYEDGGKLTERVKRNPYSIILFDEIEKAHPDLFDILLQILDEGTLTDSAGDTINFKNCFIILTSNIGANRLQKNNTLGFLSDDYNDVQDKVMQEVENTFRPEFINRLDEITIFNHLDKDNLYKIVGILLKDVLQRLKKKRMTLRIDDSVKDLLIENGYDEKFGARPLKRAIKKHIETPLADFIINNTIVDKCEIVANVKDGKVEYKLSTNSTKKGTGNST